MQGVSASPGTGICRLSRRSEGRGDEVSSKLNGCGQETVVGDALLNPDLRVVELLEVVYRDWRSEVNEACLDTTLGNSM